MQLIFTGLLFIYANFYSSFFKMIFGFNLLPYFVGYIIIYKGLFELMEESSHFQQMLPVAQVMTVVMAAVYAMNALSINSSDTILVMITWGGTLYITYHVICGILDMEDSKNIDLFGEKLFLRWKVWAVFTSLPVIFLTSPEISLFCLMATAIANLAFVSALHRSKILYYASPQDPTHETNEWNTHK